MRADPRYPTPCRADRPATRWRLAAPRRAVPASVAAGGILVVALAGALAAVAPTPARAQTWPTRPVSVVYPFAPGGTIEQAARLIVAEAGKALGQPLIFENRPGANGMVALNAVRRARWEDHLVGIANNSTLITVPLASPRDRTEPDKDYLPAALLFQSPGTVLVANPGLPVRDLQGLLAHARSHPRALNAAVIGTGGNGHLALELLKAMSNVEITNVPYKVDAQAVPDLLSGTVQLLFGGTGMVQHVSAGKLVALGVTGPGRWDSLPNVPTLKEAGLPDFEVTGWYGVIAPPGTPAEVVTRLGAAFGKAMTDAEVRKKVRDYGQLMIAAGAGDFRKRIASDLERWRPVIQNAGIRIE